MTENLAQPDAEPAPPIDALDEPVGPSPDDRRESVIDAIADARREELREDGVEFPPADEDPLPPEEGAAAPRDPLPGEPLYTVKIDGQERQVPLSELTAGYQNRDDAHNRLGQANEVLRQARAYAEVAANAPAPAAAGRQCGVESPIFVLCGFGGWVPRGPMQ